MANLYDELAGDLASSIEQGVYQVGERLPGVRITSEQRGVSIATVISAYRQLESAGYIESRPRSGFVVKPRIRSALPLPSTTKPRVNPRPVSGQELVLQLAQTALHDDVVGFGAAIPDRDFLPLQAISQALSAVAKQYRNQLCQYDFPWGEGPLTQQVAKRMGEIGCVTSVDDIVITNGCQEAVMLSLKALTKPGDIVAVESPTYYGLLQAIDVLGLKALEIPTDPQQGISLSALQLALEQWPVKACIVVANFNNPLGFVMSDEKKQALVKMVTKFNVDLIEDDIYGDMSFDHRRPSLLQSFDQKNKVIYCSSVSKTLAPGLRIGWAVSKKHVQSLRYQKFVNNCATSAINQLAVAHLMKSGRYERHLRSLRIATAQSVRRMIDRVSEYFPPQTKITQPKGGYVIWLELPAPIDTGELAQKALEQGISIAAGALFSPNQKYRHCLRLNCAVTWSDKVERALMKLGEMVNTEIKRLKK